MGWQQPTPANADSNRTIQSKEHKSTSPCSGNSILANTSCWIATGSIPHADKAIQALMNLKVETPDHVGQYGNGWLLALSYDLLSKAPQLTTQQRHTIEDKLEHAVTEYLRVLDDNSASLWHGRTSLAANAWLCAIAFDANSDKRRSLQTRAQGHFLDSMSALAITETWPEGYNYWINNRAFYVALAASAYVNGLENASLNTDIKHVMERNGLWHIHATRPDNRVEGYGDEGPKIDLKDETRRVVDVIASLSANTSLAQYSYYLEKCTAGKAIFVVTAGASIYLTTPVCYQPARQAN